MTIKKKHTDEINGKEKLLKRTLPGRLAAKKMAKLGGRPKKLNAEKIELAKKLYEDTKSTVENNHIGKTSNSFIWKGGIKKLKFE